MEEFEFNLNAGIRVRLTNAGIIHCVKDWNETLPFEHHTCFNLYKSRADKYGYHHFQAHEFMNIFGKLGLSLANLVNLNIVIPKSSLILHSQSSAK